MINSSVLTNLQQLCSEYNLPTKEWPLLLPIIEFLINDRAMKRRQTYSAKAIFLGITPKMISIEEEVNLAELVVVDKDRQKHELTDKKSLINFIDALKQNIDAKVDKVCDHLEVLRKKDDQRRKIQSPMMLQFFNWVLYSPKSTSQGATKKDAQ